eukprot:6277259-Prymnesium_polylepis.2
MVDRGASVQFASQFPKEAEILFAPLTGLEVVSKPWIDGRTIVVDLRLSTNTKDLTIEEVWHVSPQHAQQPSPPPPNPRPCPQPDHIALPPHHQPTLNPQPSPWTSHEPRPAHLLTRHRSSAR